MKRDLHTLFIKYDSDFQTLSKIALSQLILKVVLFKKTGATTNHIVQEVNTIVIGSVARKDIETALVHLRNEKKVNSKNGKYYIHETIKGEIESSASLANELLDKVIDKYFSKAETPKSIVRAWFQDATISFFSDYSFDWFKQITSNGRGKNVKHFQNLEELINDSIIDYEDIKENDRSWLNKQYIKFVESDGKDETMLFWQFGMAMLSSRLITARNYADKMTIAHFKNNKFILDTNVLMILDMEGHNLHNSLSELESALQKLNVGLVYFHPTGLEYRGAMAYKKEETIKVFGKYEKEVLLESECPFIKTALRRGCEKEEDIERMFDPLIDPPSRFINDLLINEEDSLKLAEAIENGENDFDLKSKINIIFKKRTGREKRDKPLIHDAGLIAGARYLRENEKCVVLTIDGTLKSFGVKHVVRDESELVIGLDVLLGLLAVSSGGVELDSSNFAPLFKNLVLHSLIPESNAFEVTDLAFMLSTNLKVHELDPMRIVEIATEVKKMRIAGEKDESISLFLRRSIEGDKLGMNKDLQSARIDAQEANEKKSKLEEENRVWTENYRKRRRGELKKMYNKDLSLNRVKFFSIPIIILAIVFSIYINFFDQTNINLVIEIAITIIFTLLTIWPINKKLKKDHIVIESGLEEIIDKEIREIKRGS